MSGLPIASNLYFDNHFKRPGVKLLPNEFYMTGEDMVLVTVLGSCVAACIHDRTAGIGGMNHFMLPEDEVFLCGMVLLYGFVIGAAARLIDCW